MCSESGQEANEAKSKHSDTWPNAGLGYTPVLSSWSALFSLELHQLRKAKGGPSSAHWEDPKQQEALSSGRIIWKEEEDFAKVKDRSSSGLEKTIYGPISTPWFLERHGFGTCAVLHPLPAQLVF